MPILSVKQADGTWKEIPAIGGGSVPVDTTLSQPGMAADAAATGAAIEQLSEEIKNAPDYVISEANTVIDKIAAAQGNRTFTLAAITDLHYGNGGFTDGVEHACQALKYIDERIKLDAVAVLGDITDGSMGSEGYYASGVSDFHAVNVALNNLRFAPNLRLHGNHDYYENHMAEIFRYTNAYSDDVVWGSSIGGYFYRDFERCKLRVICLNTVGNNPGQVAYSDEQAQWFANTLNLGEKDDAANWHVLILSHQPVDFIHASGCQYHMASIIDAYVKGTTYTNGNVSCDFSGKNAATLVGNIHGHIHNLLVDRIYVGATSSGVQTDVLRIATPEACYGRPNGYSGVWHEETTYGKTKNTAEDTSFVVYCIDLDTNTIKAICYGAGYDRTITYGDNMGGTDEPATYTNQLLIATDETGNIVTDGVLYMNKRMNSSGGTTDADGYFVTGYIPVAANDLVRVRWPGNTTYYMHVNGYDIDKNEVSAGYTTIGNMNTEGTDANEKIGKREDFNCDLENGIWDFNIVPDFHEFKGNVAYIRFTLSGDPSKCIVTVNEPIE